MAKRVQYARNYLELLDLFERNGIDVWLTKESVVAACMEVGIEWASDAEMRCYSLVEALRHADMTGEDRMQVTVALEAARRDDAGEPKLVVEEAALTS